MNEIPKFKRSKLTKLTPSKFLYQLRSISRQLNENPIFQNVAGIARELHEKQEEFSDAKNDARWGGKQKIARKNQLYKELVGVFHRVCDELETNYDGDMMYLYYSYIPLQRRRSTRYRDRKPINAAKNINLKRTGVSGEVKISFTIPQRDRMKSVLIEWSLDKGKTYTCSLASKSSRVTIKDLPIHIDIYFRIKIFATNNRESNWCLPRGLFVL